MCDDFTDRDLTRREAALLTGGAALAAAFPLPASAAPKAVTERMVSVTTPDGAADAWFVHPARGKGPGVILWPDIFGLRPAMQAIGKRLAEAGYAVLVVNPFYRSSKAPTFAPGTPMDATFRDKVAPMRALLTPDAVQRDATAFVAFLDAQPQVDRKRGIGTAGYCMGGKLVLQTAAAMPLRVKAGASFHGGPLATDAPDSAHRLVPKMKASVLIAVAENDDKRDPADKDRLRAAFAAANRPAEIEVYGGTLHGWCASDSAAYNPVQADHAFARMLALYQRAL